MESIYDNHIRSLKIGHLPSSPTIQQRFVEALQTLRSDLIENRPLDPTAKKNLVMYLALLDIDYSQNEQGLIDWLSLKAQDLISWSLYSQAWYKWKETDKVVSVNEEPDLSHEYHNLWSLSLDICSCYFYFNGLDKEQSFKTFMDAPPRDYTRPHGWYDQEDYLSIGEALAWLYSDLAEIKESALAKFSEYHNPYFPAKITKPTDLLISYEYYLKCWEESHSPDTIKPHSIEICAYYVQQNGLSIKNIFEELAPSDHDTVLVFCYYCCPSFKFFDVLDINKFIESWQRFLNNFEGESGRHFREERFVEHCSYYDFIKYPVHSPIIRLNISDLCWFGIKPRQYHLSYKQSLIQTLSFLGDIVNGVGYALILEAQIMRCKAEAGEDWKFEDDNQKEVYRELLKKYNSVKNWLETQSQKEKKIVPMSSLQFGASTMKEPSQ